MEDIQFKAKISSRKRISGGKHYDQYLVFVPSRFEKECKKLKKKQLEVTVRIKTG